MPAVFSSVRSIVVPAATSKVIEFILSLIIFKCVYVYILIILNVYLVVRYDVGEKEGARMHFMCLTI